MSPAEKLRLFVAVELATDLRAAIDDVSKPWRGELETFTWSRPENLHLTVTFIGHVDAAELDAIFARLATAAASVPPFATHLTRVGRFPPQGPARVLWVGLDDGDARLAGLAAAVGGCLDGVVEREDRTFSAHVTIARARHPAVVPDVVLAVAPPPLPVQVREIALFRSHLAQGSPHYEVLARWALGARVAEVP